MKKITVFGCPEIHMEDRLADRLAEGSDNPGRISMTPGGSFWEMVTGLAGEKDIRVTAAGAAGDDLPGRAVKREMSEAGIVTDTFFLIRGTDTCVRYSVMNIIDDVEMTFSGSGTCGIFDGTMARRAEEVSEKADLLVADAGMPADMIGHIADRSDIPVMLDAGDPEGAAGFRNICGKFRIIRADRRSAEVLSGMEILSKEQLEAAGDVFAEKGVEQLFITLGPGGVYYREGPLRGLISERFISSAAAAAGCARGLSALETARSMTGGQNDK